MGKTTGITWTDATWNPWQGCHHVSAGCEKCYMYREKNRYGQNPTVVVRSKKPTFDAPIRWFMNKELPDNAKIFVCSWSDFFIEEADPWRDEAWEIMRELPYTFLIPTKRTGRIQICLPKDWGTGFPNVCFLASIENMYTQGRWADLTQNLAVLHGISWEPALGPLDWTLLNPKPGWVISGGESDYDNPRPARTEWFQIARNYCVKNGIPFFHKQNGGSTKINGIWGGEELDGQVWHQFPEVHE